MASDYAAIMSENVRRYGTDIGRIGPMLLADRYDDRTHFIFELLQNAEDALGRRDEQEGPRSVTFALSGRSLRVSHYGKLFTEPDVRGICGIGEGTKSEDLTSIGRFGIGFKAVYAFTDSPKIHSGGEHFAIDSFVWPRAIDQTDTEPGETIFDFPFRCHDQSAMEDIASGLQGLGARTLLFLREIEEISWSVENGKSGLYLRSKPERLGENARKVLLIGQETVTQKDTEETWLIFSREVRSRKGKSCGYLEVAFALDMDETNQSFSVRRISDSTLVVFFPTIVPTNLGFLIQGPYRTTPSRDNVPRDDEWNRYLVRETAGLLVEALRKLREMGLLNVDVLRTLPLDRSKFLEGSMFAPLYAGARAALESEPLLPTFQGGHVTSKYSRLSRTKELRELLDACQLAALFDSNEPLTWLSEEITQDRTPELRQYLVKDLQVPEVEPSTVVSRISKVFLEAQSNVWIVQFYEFLLAQPALWRYSGLREKPIIRLENGSHITPWIGKQPQAFLPGLTVTDFPMVRRAICDHGPAREFLVQLGLTEPDPVDDVVAHVLPKYAGKNIAQRETEYHADVQRVLKAFSTDSKSQREKLLTALRSAYFVLAVDPGNGKRSWARPTDIYLPTQRLKDFFIAVSGVLIVDDRCECLRGEEVRDLLEASGAARYLQPEPVDRYFTPVELAEMRRKAGTADSTGGTSIDDTSLRGLKPLLRVLRTLNPAEVQQRAALLWETLCDVAERRGSSAFLGTYSWNYYQRRSCSFDATSLKLLNESGWVPDARGVLQRPELVAFESLSPPWKQNPFLLSKIRFKPTIIETLAKEAGIEPGVLDLLRKYGLTSEAELRKKLGIKEEPQQHEGTADPETVDDALKKVLGNAPEPTPPVPEPTGPEPPESGGDGGGGGGTRGGTGSGGGGGTGGGATGGSGTGERSETGAAGAGKRTTGGGGARPFISYVGTHPDDEEPDSDGLDQQSRMGLEEKAIQFILQRESQLLRTPMHNPGYDLFEAGKDGQPVRWVEVKAMAGGLCDRPVALSRTQFETAREHEDAYWLYVVEHAGDDESRRVVRIQDPAGKARTFTFDHGWLDVADVETDQEDREE